MDKLNLELNFLQLNNCYYGMRHGESLANVNHIIASSMESQKHINLTLEGEAQVRKSIRKNKGLFADIPIILSSDFIRAYETAMIVANKLEIPIENIQKSELLRDRFFGEYDRTSSDNYSNIWRKDTEDLNHQFKNSESVLDVVNRLNCLLFSLEKEYKHKNILLVSHGDILSILQTLFINADLKQFRFQQFQNAEIKKFN